MLLFLRENCLRHNKWDLFHNKWDPCSSLDTSPQSLKGKWKGFLLINEPFQRQLKVQEFYFCSSRSWHEVWLGLLQDPLRLFVLLSKMPSSKFAVSKALAFYKPRWSLPISDNALKPIDPRKDLVFNSSNPLIDWVWKHHRASSGLPGERLSV